MKCILGKMCEVGNYQSFACILLSGSWLQEPQGHNIGRLKLKVLTLQLSLSWAFWRAETVCTHMVVWVVLSSLTLSIIPRSFEAAVTRIWLYF